jgi:hypothetical protein
MVSYYNTLAAYRHRHPGRFCHKGQLRFDLIMRCPVFLFLSPFAMYGKFQHRLKHD